MKSTLEAPSLARSGSGQAGSDWSTVRPIMPGKVVPRLYSFNDIYPPINMEFSRKMYENKNDERD
jgi:hypothetical protein